MNGVGGVIIGLVTELDDGQHEGRIRVSFPTFVDALDSYWAPITSPMAGGSTGFRFAPRVGDECLVAFDRDDPDHPYILGFLHNGVDDPPSTNPWERIIRSVNGHVLLFEDAAPSQGNMGRLTLADGHGNTVEMCNGCLTLRGTGQIDIRAPIVTINGRPVVPGAGPV